MLGNLGGDDIGILVGAGQSRVSVMRIQREATRGGFCRQRNNQNCPKSGIVKTVVVRKPRSRFFVLSLFSAGHYVSSSTLSQTGWLIQNRKYHKPNGDDIFYSTSDTRLINVLFEEVSQVKAVQGRILCYIIIYTAAKRGKIVAIQGVFYGAPRANYCKLHPNMVTNGISSSEKGIHHPLF